MEIIIFGSPVKNETVELTADARTLDIQSDDYSLENDIRVTCMVHRNGDLATVKGEAVAPVTVTCARCLEAFGVEVSGVVGTGAGGLVTEADVRALAARGGHGRLRCAPATAAAAGGGDRAARG